MQPSMDVIDVVRLLGHECKRAGGQKAWAEAHNLSPAYVSDVVCGRKAPGASIIAALGLFQLPPRYAKRRIKEVVA